MPLFRGVKKPTPQDGGEGVVGKAPLFLLSQSPSAVSSQLALQPWLTIALIYMKTFVILFLVRSSPSFSTL
jgi:hypothetical protein